MGSKNRILLGLISNSINHYFRNIFFKEVFMTVATAKKIEDKHPPLDKEFIHNHNFQIVIDNTIMISYDEERNIYDCLSKISENFFVYGLISKSNRTEVTTLFRTNPSQIKSKFIDKKNLVVIKKEVFILN